MIIENSEDMEYDEEYYGVSRPSWGKWYMWQFTDRALVRGIGCADLNVMPLR